MLSELARLAEMSEMERELRRLGFRQIAGTDEVGRGCLAGPVVAAAVILDGEIALGVRDSKQLQPHIRLAVFHHLLRTARAISVAVVEPRVIDRINILEASKLAMKRSIVQLDIRPDIVITDAVAVETLDVMQLPVIRGDSRIVAVAAASIVAKVYRDRLMDSYHGCYPEYDFENNRGYATESHRQALSERGLTPIHRRSFESGISGTLFD